MKNKPCFHFSAAWRRVAVCLSVGLAVLATNCGAADAGKFDGPRWSLLDADKVIAAAKEITTAKYPDSDQATVDKKMVRVYRPDGTGESQDETFTKVLTEKGKRANRNMTLFFMLPYFTVEVAKLEIIKPGGERVAVDVAANSKEMIDDSQMGMNIYDPNMKLLKVNIPQLEVGDVVHSVVRMVIHRAIIEGQFSDSNLFEDSGVIRHLTYEVYEPGEKPLKNIVLRDEVPGTVKRSSEKLAGNVTLHRWEVTDVPRMFEEASMPPGLEVLQRLLVSTSPDWEYVSKWYYNLCRPHLDATTPEMKATVAELSKDSKTDLDRVKAVFYHVAQKIRYMGITPEKDRPGFEPHDVKLTFDNKYGVCRDKAALLVAMLEAAGFKTYPVLINVGTKLDMDVPSPDFNHAIVAVELKPREYTLMDPTDENTKELLPSSECDQTYLVCRPEGETLKLSPIISAEENMLRVKTVATLNAAGTLAAKSEISFDGINDNAYRTAFARMKPDDKRRFFERACKRTMPGARIESVKITPEDAMDVSQPLHVSLAFTVPGMTAAGNGKAVVRLPWIGKGMGIVNYVLQGTGLEKRKYPLRTSLACGVREDVSIQLGAGYTGQISMPSYAPIKDQSLDYQRRVALAGSQLECSSEFKLQTVQFSPSQYAELKRTLKVLDEDERKEPVLALASDAVTKADETPRPTTKTSVESNSRIIASHKELTIQDARHAVLRGKYTKEVLTYAGKKNEGEFKLGYNPAVEDVKLIKAVVTSKTGTRQEITEKEINVMDAGWNASAKRYTGSKVLVASLPGVDVGSTIEVEYEITTKGKSYIAGFEAFQLFDDLEKKEFQLTAPANVKVQTVNTGPAGIVTASTSDVSGSHVYQWQAQKVPALPAEGQLPPEWSYLAGVDYFAGDMKTYLTELNTTLMDRASQSAKAGETAKKLVADAKGKKAGVKAIRDFVAKNIRHGGPSFTELPLSELSAADTTLKDGYGHAADRAILLHAMLSAAGYAPEFVLASGLPPVAGITNVALAFPLPQSFSLPLVRVPVDGVTCYLNDTDQYAELGTTGSDGRMAIALANQNFDVVRAAPEFRDKTETDYTLAISDTGKTRVGITRRYFGNAFNGKNRYFAELPPEERRRYYQELVSNVSQGAQPIGDLTTKFDRYPGEEKFTVDVDRYAVVDGRYAYLDLPYTPSLFPLGADSRTLPLYVANSYRQTVTTRLDLPKGFQRVAIAPDSENFNAPDGAGKVRITSTEQDGHRLIVHELETAPAIIPVANYPALLKLESALGRKSAKTVLLESSNPVLP
jgi:hypothetical protein